MIRHQAAGKNNSGFINRFMLSAGFAGPKVNVRAIFPGVGGGRRGAVNQGLFMYMYLELAITTCQYFSHFVEAGTGGF